MPHDKSQHAIKLHKATSGPGRKTLIDNSIINEQDSVLKKQILSCSTKDPEFWSFRHNAKREMCHAYFQYPAMMVPQMQGELIDCALTVDSSIKHIFDPYVGSGTSMSEAIIRGLDFTGYDINPLAILACHTKRGPFFAKSLKEKVDLLEVRIANDTQRTIDVKFPGRDKWFRRYVAFRLSKIRRNIMKEPALWARRFFWISLAETVRLTSNSRTSTFKLHIRPGSEIEGLSVCPIKIFKDILNRNLDLMIKQSENLKKGELLNAGRYTRKVSIKLKDTSLVPASGNGNDKFDLLVTSPPYGDNATTVPYGQYSYLPLQWINLQDIDKGAYTACLNHTRAIDSQSLGGSLIISKDQIDHLKTVSKHFESTIGNLKDHPKDRVKRLASFCRDLDSCIDPILSTLKENAYMFWTLGNRRIGGEIMPMDKILIDMLKHRGAKHITTISRQIPSKRMAVRNSVADTMRNEAVIIMRKGTEQC